MLNHFSFDLKTLVFVYFHCSTTVQIQNCRGRDERNSESGESGEAGENKKKELVKLSSPDG